MKKEFKVHIHNKGIANAEILNAIGNHNGGHSDISIYSISRLLEQIKHENYESNIDYTFDVKAGQIDVWEGNEENFTLHIEEVEKYELNPDAGDILGGIFKSIGDICEDYEKRNNIQSKN